MKEQSKKTIANTVLFLTCLLLGYGFFYFEQYKFTPGEQIEGPIRFPASVNSYLDKDVPTLILFAHPKCTCTEATLVELSKLKVELGPKIAVKIFISYDLKDYTPEHEVIEAQARTIASVTVEKDLNRVVAKQFGALTSGQTLLYAPEGNLLFQGGITISRGHTGESAGTREIKKIVSSPFIINSYGRLPTFGCHL